MRCFCDEETTNWDDLLPPLEFAYNNAYQASTQQTPFFMNYGRHPKLPERIALGLSERPHTDAQQLVSTLAESHSLAKQCISLAQERQSKQANRKRRKEKFEIGQQVWLSTKHLTRDGRQWKKLQPRWAGPFRIIRVISDNAVEIDSAAYLHKFHPVVNVSRLKRHHTNKLSSTGQPEDIADSQEGPSMGLTDVPDADFLIQLDE